MCPNQKRVLPPVVGCNLNRTANALANALNKVISRPVSPLSDLVRNDKFRVRVNASPSPKIAALLFSFNHAASMNPNVLPLLVHFDSFAWQITEIGVHVICERFSR